MAAAPAYNRWMFDRLSPWVGRRILEVGAGIGNMSQFFVDRERVVLTDTEPAYREALVRRFAGRPGVRIGSLSLPEISPDLRGEAFDTIVCLNVLEHIEDDAGALEAMRELLEPEGRLVLLVPALPAIYGSLDRHLGHHRRYTPRLLRERYRAAGLAMRRLEYFNLAGIPGWWFTGRVLRRKMIPAGPLGLYDRLVPLFRLERLLPWRLGQSLIAVGERR
jgi:SAM-dependent methyltransferase